METRKATAEDLERIRAAKRRNTTTSPFRTTAIAAVDTEADGIMKWLGTMELREADAAGVIADVEIRKEIALEEARSELLRNAKLAADPTAETPAPMVAASRRRIWFDGDCFPSDIETW